MTIAVGLLASDGIVVAADTQMTLAGGKFNQGKMRAGFYKDQDSNGAYVMAGAGWVGHMNRCAGLLRHALTNKALAGEPLRQALETTLSGFYSAHLHQWASYPADDRPSVEFVIAVEREKQSELWTTEGTTVVDGKLVTAIGVGKDQALSILGNLTAVPFMNVHETSLLAAYVVYQVKQSNIYCGGHTDLYFTKNGGGFGMFNRRLTADIDAAFEQYGPIIEANMFRRMIGAEASTRAKDEDDLRSTFAELVKRLSPRAAR